MWLWLCMRACGCACGRARGRATTAVVRGGGRAELERARGRVRVRVMVAVVERWGDRRQATTAMRGSSVALRPARCILPLMLTFGVRIAVSGEVAVAVVPGGP